MGILANDQLALQTTRLFYWRALGEREADLWEDLFAGFLVFWFCWRAVCLLAVS